ncbi:30S ribosomal protein S1 [Buchnera aphidicola (Schlechtendalia chinensis)]|uniref:30S ribosomal protein S1 n=1 Tax=Buchnera aphidicola subsp. Schlechtendalia chinensis TaxID=118110 RepID=A0A172WDQ8_BUCSC|nr:30S ribosomal protein S1 [Buchnera aphidicola]ANF17065.1 30S ribosomal protein S1 [Buchnera aphidicola (Schlechtendalia chinensis)]
MTESFAQLFQESLKTIETKPGSIIKGIVIAINKDTVLVDAGLKSESTISIEQFKNTKGNLEVKIGDKVDVALDAIEDGFGETILSREKAKRYEAWLTLERAYKDSKTVIGTINGKVKGGFTVELENIRAFLPGSLVDIRPVRDTNFLEGKELEFKVIKLDQKRNNVVVSRRAVIESEHSIERNLLLENLQEGITSEGIVKNLTDYGAFVDLGGVDGLLHITDMAWKRVKHPSEVVNIGDKIKVKILKFDREKIRVSLGLKQLGDDPWTNISKKYLEGKKLTGKVTNLTDYGCFVEIEEGVEGLVHVSEMDWTNKNVHPSKIVHVNSIIEVIVLDIDEEKRRISLGLKQCTTNPWKKFSEENVQGTCVQGKIKSITDFGIFIGLHGGIDGLVHLSDISWNLSGEEAVKTYKKGDEISAMVLQVDSERERISLGIKQLTNDPFDQYVSNYKKDDIVSGIVDKIDNKVITVQLSKLIKGYIKISELSTSYNNNFSNLSNFVIGKQIDVKFSNIDRKNKIINLSIVVLENLEDKDKIDDQNANKSNENFSNAMTEAFKAAKNLDLT